ncbi:MAG TPA: BMP family ABC transporter substrate-binding protein [Myxococcales bacterium]|jgi:basic membrane protein A
MFKNRKRWLVAAAALAVAAVGLGTGCPPGAAGDPDTGVPLLKVAFVYITTPGDIGWTYAHDQGRKKAMAELTNVEMIYKDNVPEGPDAVPVLDQLVADGNQLIFTTSFGYMDATLEAANKHKDVKFEHCSGYKTAENMSNYFGRMYQARYLSGLVAGKMTTNGKIGYVAAFPIPEVIRMMNAFTLGVRKVNPTATVQVEWTSTWYEPGLEGAAAQKLLDAGCDVLAQHQDSTATVEKARAAGKYAIGYNADMVPVAPDTVLTTPIWHWEVYYKDRIEAVQKGTWKSQSWWGDLGSGIVDIGPYSTKVPQDVKDLVAATKKDLVDKKFDVFWGPLKKQGGAEWLAEGAKMSDADMLGMMDLVDGVVGTIPPPGP